jgi:hypothetical protein
MNSLKYLAAKEEWAESFRAEPNNVLHISCAEEWGENSVLSSKAIRSLLQHLSISENAELHEKIEEQSERLDKLERAFQELFDPKSLSELGEFEIWCNELPADSEFRGKHVAYKPKKGVIAYSDSLDELTKIALKKTTLEELTFGFVPTTAVTIK